MVEYKFVLEAAVNGAQAPPYILDYTNEPSENFPWPNDLTKKGADQHFASGIASRDKYFQDVDMTNMLTAKVYAQTTQTGAGKQSTTS